MFSRGYYNNLRLKENLMFHKLSNNKNYSLDEYYRILIVLKKIIPFFYNPIFFRKLIYCYIRPNNFLYKKGYNVLWNNIVCTIVKVNLYGRNMIRTTKSYNLLIRQNQFYIYNYEENQKKDDEKKNILVKKVNPLECTLTW